MPPTVIHLASLDDPRLADYRDVKDRQLAGGFLDPHADPADRDAPPVPGRFMAEGEVVFNMLLTSAVRIVSVLISTSRVQPMRAKLARLPDSTPVYVITDAAIESLVGFNLHRGLLAVCERPAPRTVAEVAAMCQPGRPLVVLEDLANHDNVGGIFRSAAGLGAAGIILSSRCADPLYRKSLRVSVGCVLHVAWARARDWPGDIEQLRRAGIRAIGLAIGPGASRLDAAAADAQSTSQRVALIVGTEGPGLSPGLLELCDDRMVIPMAPGVDSLNVNVSVAIALSRFATPDTEHL